MESSATGSCRSRCFMGMHRIVSEAQPTKHFFADPMKCGLLGMECRNLIDIESLVADFVALAGARGLVVRVELQNLLRNVLGRSLWIQGLRK